MADELTRRLKRITAGSSTSRELLRRIGRDDLADSPAISTTSLTDLLDAAAHEAALARHPYVGAEHVEVGALQILGEHELVARGRQHLMTVRVAGHAWWRMRGRNSALRRRGQTALDRRQREARQREK